MSSGGSNYCYSIEELVKKYREEFRASGYLVNSYEIEVNSFTAWLCEELEKERNKNLNRKGN